MRALRLSGFIAATLATGLISPALAQGETTSATSDIVVTA
jgi:hypothetical protein